MIPSKELLDCEKIAHQAHELLSRTARRVCGIRIWLIQHFIVEVNHLVIIIIWLSLVFNSDASESATIYFSTQAQVIRRKRQSEAGSVVFYGTLGVYCVCACRTVVNFMSKRNFRAEQGIGLNFLLLGTLGTDT